MIIGFREKGKVINGPTALFSDQISPSGGNGRRAAPLVFLSANPDEFLMQERLHSRSSGTLRVFLSERL